MNAPVNYQFTIVSPKHGTFVVTVPNRFRSEIESRTWHVNYVPARAEGNQFEVAHSFRNADGTYGSVRLHQLIMQLAGKPTAIVDHVDRNPLNNSEDNLRDGVKGNAKNRGKQKTNRSGYVGVGWHEGMQKWRARINIDGKLTHLGLFDSIEQAVAARDAAATRHHGEFAFLNQGAQ